MSDMDANDRDASDKYRPAPAERQTSDRTDPVTFDVRTRWLYSEVREGEPGCACCPGRHAFSRGGDVTRSDVPARYDSERDVAGHLYRAIRAFGDDADLVIEVRRATDPRAEG